MMLVFIDVGIKCCNFSEQGNVTWPGKIWGGLTKEKTPELRGWGHGAGWRGGCKVD